MAISEIIIRNGKVVGAHNIDFLYVYLAYKVCIVFVLYSDTKITAINTRRTVPDWLELCDFLPTIASVFYLTKATSLIDGVSTSAKRNIFSSTVNQSFIETTS
jgi:hypothetical protein